MTLLSLLSIIDFINNVNYERGLIMSQNFTSFRNLLRIAICNRTQAQFANESGISAEHLNRMLNAETINRPTRTTLTKIASAAKNGVTFQRLIDALDAEDEKKQTITAEVLKREQKIKEAQQDFAPTFEEMAQVSIENLNHIIRDQIAYPFIIKSAADVMETIMDTYNEWDPKNLLICYDIGKSRKYIGTRHPDVQDYIPIDLSMSNYETSAETTMLLYYTKVADQLVVQDITLAVADIEDLYGMPLAAMDEKDADDDGTKQLDDAYAKPYYIEFTSNCHFREIYRSKEENLEKRVLESIFGEKQTYPTSIVGTGFWVKDVPKNFGKFISEHIKSVITAYEDEPDVYEKLETELHAILEETQDNNRLVQFFDEFDDHGYFDFENYQYGWLGTISNVMRQETGWTFESFQHVTSDDWKDRSEYDCIMIRSENVEKEEIKREALLNAICQYAYELEIDTFGDILFHTVIEDFQKPHTYQVQPREKPGKPTDENISEFHKLTPDTVPEKTGAYMVKLKDERILQCIYLKDQNLWIRSHKEWSHMIDSFDPTPVKVDTK